MAQHLERKRCPEAGWQARSLQLGANPDVAAFEHAEMAFRGIKGVGPAVTIDGGSRRPRRDDGIAERPVMRDIQAKATAILLRARAGAVLDVQCRGAETGQGVECGADIEVTPIGCRAVKLEVAPPDADVIENPNGSREVSRRKLR